MFGLFTKPDLSLAERAALMLTVVAASLMAYAKHNAWPSEDHRATVIRNWLQRNDRKAGAMFRSKISAAADQMARVLVASESKEEIQELWFSLERAEYLPPGTDPELDHLMKSLLSSCQKIIVAKRLAS